MFLILHLLKLCVIEVACEPQLWEWGKVETETQGDSLWEPDRKAKSLAFLGKDEDAVIEHDNNSVDSDEPEETTKLPKKAKLNVSDKDSPYALIDKYFPERESYFYQNKNKFLKEYEAQAKKTDIGNVDPSEVSNRILGNDFISQNVLKEHLLVFCPKMLAKILSFLHSCQLV